MHNCSPTNQPSRTMIFEDELFPKNKAQSNVDKEPYKKQSVLPLE